MYPGFRWHHFTEAKYMVNEFISPTEIKAWGIDEPVYCSWSLYIVFYAGKWCHKETMSGRVFMFTTCTIFPDEKGNWFFATPNLTEVLKALKNAISTNSLP